LQRIPRIRVWTTTARRRHVTTRRIGQVSPRRTGSTRAAPPSTSAASGPHRGTRRSDAEGNPFDGSKTYAVHLPENVPAKDFWSFTLYDNQTRAMFQTDQRFRGIDNNKPGMIQNSDGSYDIYFGPEAPDGQENNWGQTVPGKSGNTLFRLYGRWSPDRYHFGNRNWIWGRIVQSGDPGGLSTL
jgi:hypothetical protein